jgi:hypothetical protein
MNKLRIETLGNSGGRGAHAAVSPRPPISLYTIILRTGGYTHAAEVWDVSIIQGTFSVAPCQPLTLRFATFASQDGAVEVVGNLVPRHNRSRTLGGRGLVYLEAVLVACAAARAPPIAAAVSAAAAAASTCPGRKPVDPAASP